MLDIAHSSPTPTKRGGRPNALLRQMVRHSRLVMALKVAAAASIAWAVVQPVGGVVEDYQYYAPLGAVVAVSTTVVASAREAIQSVLAILLGAAIAIVLELVIGSGLATLAAVMGLGTLLAGWSRLGGAASWVPISALFVLILGGGNPVGYVLAYAGLVGLGAAIGVTINLILPPLPLDATGEALERLRETMARQLDELAESLLAEHPVGLEDWQRRSDEIEAVSAGTRAMVHRATEAQRANWRARRWRTTAQQQYDAALTLEQLPLIVKDVTGIIVYEGAGGDVVPWGAPLRPRIAHALQAFADLLRSIEGSGAAQDDVAEADEALERLVQELRETREATGDDQFGVGSLVTTLRRARSTIRVREDRE